MEPHTGVRLRHREAKTPAPSYLIKCLLISSPGTEHLLRRTCSSRPLLNPPCPYKPILPGTRGGLRSQESTWGHSTCTAGPPSSPVPGPGHPPGLRRGRNTKFCSRASRHTQLHLLAPEWVFLVFPFDLISGTAQCLHQRAGFRG